MVFESTYQKEKKILINYAYIIYLFSLLYIYLFIIIKISRVTLVALKCFSIYIYL